MPFIEGVDRNQINLFPYTLDDYVSEDNPVRVIDAYVDSLNLEEIGFKIFSGQNAGQKPYRRKDLLKLYIYCYMNRIRSSRRMEVEATRNIEVMWLVGKITPDHGTLSAFMKNNKEAIKQLFKEFTLMLKGFGLIDGNLIAIDGTKIKANNAKNKHYNENIIKKKIEYYESKIEEYINDFLNTTDNENLKQTMTEKIESYKARIEQLTTLKKDLKEQGKKQVCLTDPDAKSMKNNGKFEVCFNMQTVVDSKHKLLVDFEVVNDVNDQSQLSNMVNKAKQVFGEEEITAVADTGYFNMSEIINTVDDSTEILIKKQKGKQEKIQNGFDKANFQYDKTNDVYICPMGYVLKFKWNGKQNGKDYKRYTCENYMDCGKKDSCTSSKGGRAVTRLKEEEIIEMVDENTIKKNDIYRKRGSIVEHPFGTIKRHFGYTYFLTRGLNSVNAEGGFICLVYNLKRLINIMGVKELVRRFREIIASRLYIFFILLKITKKALSFMDFNIYKSIC
ncbi:MAG: hypothetical protein PWQ96_1554 [Clostridia bacterium]|jgi:transposase|nr:transposase [Clostridiales bacterium]MDK2985911.1 hypothetical protein [Clostridia bacterium]